MVINEQRTLWSPGRHISCLNKQIFLSLPPYVINVYLFLYLAQCSPFEEKMKVSG